MVPWIVLKDLYFSTDAPGPGDRVPDFDLPTLGGGDFRSTDLSDYADTLLQRNEPGDREKAMSLLDESLAISSELGMRPLMERVLSRREILKA